jgi:hypothetical protein
MAHTQIDLSAHNMPKWRSPQVPPACPGCAASSCLTVVSMSVGKLHWRCALHKVEGIVCAAHTTRNNECQCSSRSETLSARGCRHRSCRERQAASSIDVPFSLGWGTSMRMILPTGTPMSAEPDVRQSIGTGAAAFPSERYASKVTIDANLDNALTSFAQTICEHPPAPEEPLKKCRNLRGIELAQ